MTATDTTIEDTRDAESEDFRAFQKENAWSRMLDGEGNAALLARWARSQELPGLFVTVGDGIWGYVKDDASTSSGYAKTHSYVVSEDECSCPDAENRAPFSWCKHRLSLWSRMRRDAIMAKVNAYLEERRTATPARESAQG